MGAKPFVERLSNGDGFQYPLGDYVSVGGERLERTGLKANEEIVLGRAALLAGQDPVIQAALHWICKQDKP